jgi:foldase protein PrsA
MSKVQRLTVGLAALLFGASLAACASGGTIATVNGQPISQAAFDTKLEGTPLARTVLQQMVQDALIDQYAKNNNITVSDADINAREDQIKQNFPAGSWDEMLKSRGLSEEDVHSALREQLILDKALGSQVKVTPAQITDYFDKNRATFDKPEQVTARHILVPNLAEAQKVEQLLKSGQNFADVAKQYSTDPGSKDKGGDLGTFKRGQMVPAFDKVAFSEPVNAISAPVKSPFGYHIIQVEARIPGTKATLASATPQITDTLRQQQEAPLIQPFLQGLQQKADIKINNPNFAGLFPSPPPGSAMGAPPAPAGAGAAASPAGSASAASPAAASPAPSST